MNVLCLFKRRHLAGGRNMLTCTTWTLISRGQGVRPVRVCPKKWKTYFASSPSRFARTPKPHSLTISGSHRGSFPSSSYRIGNRHSRRTRSRSGHYHLGNHSLLHMTNARRKQNGYCKNRSHSWW